MSRRPGTPRLLRQLNDRAALELLLSSGPLTRTQLGEATGLSKVTASQLLARLEERELVHVVGTKAGGRGPNAALYAVVPSSAYVAALDVGPTGVSAAVADVTGRIVTEVDVDPTGSDEPVELVHTAVMRLVESAEIPMERLTACVIGTPGVVDPRTGDVRFSFDLPSWHEGVLEALRTDLKRSVVIENDVNLAALAEHTEGVAAEVSDFVLIWINSSGGVGMSIVLGDRVHRGHSGGAGEIGYLPVPGAPLPDDIGLPGGYEPAKAAYGRPWLAHGFQSLVVAREVRALAEAHGLPTETATTAVSAAVNGAERGTEFLDELAQRIARGVASVCVILDPGLVVLGGDVALAGGADLARRVAAAAGRIGPNPSDVAVSGVEGNPVLRGAILAALKKAREELFASTVE